MMTGALDAMAGSVVPTEITYMDMEDIQIRYIVFGYHQIHIFNVHILYLEIIQIHIFKSIFRFLISSLGLPNFSFSEMLRGSIGKIYR
jgi:hypothetical protein